MLYHKKQTVNKKEGKIAGAIFPSTLKNEIKHIMSTNINHFNKKTKNIGENLDFLTWREYPVKLHFHNK